MIDAHQHFWNPRRGDYGWMPADDPIISQFYGPTDLKPSLEHIGIQQTVLVQAAPSLEETAYMLGIADVTPFVAKVVGWIDFEDSTQRPVLERLAQHPKFVGVRPMIQDIEDDDWMLRKDIQWAFEAIIELGLTFDCLGFPRHMENFRTLLMRYPDMKSVLDHCLKPQLRFASPQEFSDWADGMARLAQDTTACCKISGLVTEDDRMPSAEKMQPYIDHIVKIFGADRIMWGSDWPVCRLRCSYEDWHQLSQTLLSGLSPQEKNRVFQGTALEFYGIESM